MLWTCCKSISSSIWRTWTRVGGVEGLGETERSLAHTSWNLQASLCQSWQGNLQRCKPSLGVHLAVSKLLWELRAGILEQAIPLCLSFCLSVLNSPSALIHSHIQFPALSIHQSPHFVSADFIPALTITLQPSPGHRGPPPHAHSHLLLPDRDLLTEGPAGGLSSSIAQASKNTNTQPDSYWPVFHLSYWGEWKRERHKREKRGGGEWGRIMERDVCWIF